MQDKADVVRVDNIVGEKRKTQFAWILNFLLSIEDKRFAAGSDVR